MAVGVAVVGATGFITAAILGADRLAAALILAGLIGYVSVTVSPLSRYLTRHAGMEPTANAVMAGVAIAIAFVVGDDDLGALRLVLGVGLVAVATTVVEYTAWARFGVELAGSGLPEIDKLSSDFRWFDRTSRPFSTIETSFGRISQLAAIATTVAVATPADELALTWSLALWAASYLICAFLAWGSAYIRVAFGDNRKRPAFAAAIAAYRPQVLVHFPGSLHARYQLDQWMGLLERGDFRSMLVIRDLPTFRALQRAYASPVIYIKEFPDLDLVVTPETRAALYTNTGTQNNHLVRFSQITHIQLHHGDSDKPSSSGKPLKLYDKHFVAGPVGVERLIDAGIADRESIVVVGRPITDSLVTAPEPKTRTVLYAPTWEGFHMDSALSSVGRTAEALITKMPSNIRLIVRPHPLTGTSDRRMKANLGRLKELARKQGRSVEYSAPDPDRPLVDLMRDASVLIADVSSVLVDFLATGRPAIVTDVNGLDDELALRYPSTAWAGRLAPDASNLRELLDDAFGPDANSSARAEMQERMLSHLGAAAVEFDRAISAIVGSAGDIGEASPETSTPD